MKRCWCECLRRLNVRTQIWLKNLRPLNRINYIFVFDIWMKVELKTVFVCKFFASYIFPSISLIAPTHMSFSFHQVLCKVQQEKIPMKGIIFCYTFNKVNKFSNECRKISTLNFFLNALALKGYKTRIRLTDGIFQRYFTLSSR